MDVEMELARIIIQETSEQQFIFLKECQGSRSFPIVIGIHEAVMGAKIEVPTITGRVSLVIPKGASSGQILRLRGKGVKNAQSGNSGDQLVKLRIVMPQRIDRELQEFMENWAELHAYNPRARLREKA